MGFFDKAKRLLGLDPEDADADGAEAERPETRVSPEGTRGGSERSAHAERIAAARGRTGRGPAGRPPLPDEAATQSGPSLDDALAARDRGDHAEARRVLREIDRGGGLRTLLRAAAALEAGDEGELAPLLDTVAAEEPAWRMLLQLASALGDSRAEPWIERAREKEAPAWALAWARALSTDPAARREGLVELLFADAALARTVAARDLAVDGAAADGDAAQRYASFAHGRDTMKRFGAAAVASVIDRARSGGGPRR